MTKLTGGRVADEKEGHAKRNAGMQEAEGKEMRCC